MIELHNIFVMLQNIVMNEYYCKWNRIEKCLPWNSQNRHCLPTLLTFTDTLWSSGAVRVDFSPLTSYDFTAQQIVLRITSYSDGSSVCNGIWSFSRQEVLNHHSSTSIWRIGLLCWFKLLFNQNRMRDHLMESMEVLK